VRAHHCTYRMLHFWNCRFSFTTGAPASLALRLLPHMLPQSIRLRGAPTERASQPRQPTRQSSSGTWQQGSARRLLPFPTTPRHAVKLPITLSLRRCIHRRLAITRSPWCGLHSSSFPYRSTGTLITSILRRLQLRIVLCRRTR
jgi:hypothetical protein